MIYLGFYNCCKRKKYFDKMKGKSQIKRFLFKINHKQLNIRLLKFMYLIKIYLLKMLKSQKNQKHYENCFTSCEEISFEPKIIKRSIKFLNSRILPGHVFSCNIFIAFAEIFFFEIPISLQIKFKK